MSLETTAGQIASTPDKDLPRLHIAHSPECENFLEYVNNHFNPKLEQEFYFIGGSEESIPGKIKGKPICFEKNVSELTLLLKPFVLCHFHWAFEPALLQLANHLQPECYVLVSYLTDDYSSAQHLPSPLVSFADELVLADIPEHLSLAATATPLAAAVFDSKRSSGLSKTPKLLAEGRYQSYTHLWAHPRVRSILDSKIDGQDPRFAGREPSGSWYFAVHFPDLLDDFNNSRKSLYPQKALDADENIRSRARKLLDLGLEKFQQFFPDDSYLRLLLGMAFVETGQLDRADYLLSSVTQILHPWRVQLLRGQIQALLENSESALEQYAAVLSDYPECKQAKEAMRVLVHSDGSPSLVHEIAAPPAQNAGSKEPSPATQVSQPLPASDGIVFIPVCDSALFQTLCSFFGSLFDESEYLCFESASEAYKELFYLPDYQKSQLRGVLCNEPLESLHSILKRKVSFAFIASSENARELKGSLREAFEFEFLGVMDKLPETLYLLRKYLRSDKNAYISLPKVKVPSFERLDSNSPPEQEVLEESRAALIEKLLALSAGEQNDLDFYKRALVAYPEVQNAATPELYPEVVQAMLQNSLKHFGVVSSQKSQIDSLRKLLDFSNDKLQRQVLYTGEQIASVQEFKERLDSASEFARFKQLDVICLADTPEKNFAIQNILLEKGLSKKKILLAL